MKKFKNNLDFKNGVLLVIVLMIGFIGISICIAEKIGTNTASIIGGILSALATVFLGLIAIWQNTRFKEMADEANDIQIRPEFFVSYQGAIKEEHYNMPSLHIMPRQIQGSVEFFCVCKVLESPILKIKPLGLRFIRNDESSEEYFDFYSQNSEEHFFQKGDEFRIFLPKHEQQCHVDFELGYENIYGIAYIKSIHYDAPGKDVVPEEPFFGKYESGKITFDPARRQ